MTVAHEYLVVCGKGPRFSGSVVVTARGALSPLHSMKAIGVGIIEFAEMTQFQERVGWALAWALRS